MKKIYLILWTVIITLLVVCTTFEIKQNKKTKEEIKRLEKIIELKQEINKEYVYLFKETENKNLKQEINDKQIKIEEAAKTIENLQTTINERQQENQNIKEEIDIKQQELNRIIEERRQIEEQRRLDQKKGSNASITYSMNHSISNSPKKLRTRSRRPRKNEIHIINYIYTSNQSPLKHNGYHNSYHRSTYRRRHRICHIPLHLDKEVQLCA